jgi:DNA/RNA-binding domain of Phe-tRNA-synthetase-like protein
MPGYSVESAIFEMFPAFRRGVVVASGLDNSRGDPETGRLLTAAASGAAADPAKIEVWNQAYRQFGADPDKHTPSIRYLHQQIQKGKPPRPISKVVDLFNIISLRWMAPCGGDDLAALEGGDLRLGLARGDETFAPLFKPTAVERPLPGEVIYYTPQTRRVLCRRWTWRNADFSKITPQTHSVAINVDMMMPPFTPGDLDAALADLAGLLGRFCGGEVRTHVLSPETPSFVF